MAGRGREVTLEQWRDLAATILLVEGFALALVPLAAACLLVRALGRLLPRIQTWLRAGYDWTLQVGVTVRQAARWLLAPIIFLSGLRVGVRQGMAILRRR